MMKQYVLSYTVDALKPKLVRRPWWNIFGRDSIVMERVPTRITHLNVNEYEASILMARPPCRGFRELLHRFAGGNVTMMQLEEGINPSTNYVESVSGLRREAARTNLMRGE